MMYTYNYSAKEAIAWVRLCRPGSIVGGQQYFLEEMEQDLYDVMNQPEPFIKDSFPLKSHRPAIHGRKLPVYPRTSSTEFGFYRDSDQNPTRQDDEDESSKHYDRESFGDRRIDTVGTCA